MQDFTTTPVRTTRTRGYLLPPEPPRATAVYDGWGRYKLPSPTTGRPTGYTRATTVASTLDDTYNLSRWSRRETVRHVLTAAGAAGESARLFAGLQDALDAGDKGAVDSVLDAIDDLGGGKDAAELGTAVHAWLEAVDVGQILPADVPPQFQPYVTSYRRVLARYGMTPVPEYVERVVLNDSGEETIAGTLDRVVRLPNGELVLADVKTSKTLEYGYLSHAVQLALYGHASWMLKTDGTGWEPMPTLNRDYAVILHVPSDQPERAEAVTMDLAYGLASATVALDARRRRKEAKKRVPFIHALPIPTAEALRYTQARHAIQDISDPADLAAIWEKYQDVWSDDLTQLGEQLAALLTPQDER
jgi:hypothetical protein